MTPTSASIPLGFSQQFVATATYSDGSSKDVTKSATWSSSNTRVASVANGNAFSLGCIDFTTPGDATISATLNAVVGSANLTVTESVLISVGPITIPGFFTGTATVEVGKTIALAIMGSYSGNQCMVDGGSPVPSSWSSSNAAVVTVDNGVVTGISIGKATITATVTTYSGPVTQTAPAVSLGAAPRYVVVANGGSNNVSVFTNSSGNPADDPTLRVDVSLTQVPGSPFATGSRPSAVATVSTTSFLYVGNGESNDVSAFILDTTTGNLTAIAGSPFAVGGGPSAVMASADGNFLYVANAGENNISGFRIDSGTGSLAPLSSSPFTAGSQPSAFATSGSFLYVTNAGSNNVSAYAIDAITGNLLPVTGSPFAAGTKPIALTIDVTGKFLYTANQGSNDISGYVIDGTSGQLQTITVPSPAVPLYCSGSQISSLSASPMGGLFVAIANNGSGNCTSSVTEIVLAAAIDPSTGALGQGPSSGWVLYWTSSDPVDSASAVAADTSGRFVYVTNSGHNLLGVGPDFSGANYRLPPFPSTGTKPVAIAIVK